MSADEEFVREWWGDVRYSERAVGIKHPDWKDEVVVFPSEQFYYSSDEVPGRTMMPIHKCSEKCDCEIRAWAAAAAETRNYLYVYKMLTEEKSLLEDILKYRKSKGIRELHDQTPIGRLLDRQEEIIYAHVRFLKKKISLDDLQKMESGL